MAQEEHTHPLGNPAPLAVLAFATTSFMLGVYNTGIVPHGGIVFAMDVALAFGGLVQVIVAVLEFFAGNTFTTAVFGTYGPFWLALAAFELWFGRMVPAAAVASAVTLFLIAFGVLTFIFLVASLKTDKVLVAVFLLIEVAIVFLAIGAASGVDSWTRLGGWTTIAFAILAWYHAAAALFASMWGRQVLPLGRLG